MVDDRNGQPPDVDAQTGDSPADAKSSRAGHNDAHAPRQPAAAMRWVARQLQTVVPECATRGRTITETYDESRKSIEQQYETRKSDIDEKLSSATKDADAQLSQVERRVQSECAAAFAEADRVVEQLREQSNDKARTNTQAAQKAHEEATWMAEAMYEANEAQPREQYEQTRKSVESQMDAIDEIEEAAAKQMRRYRQRTRPNIAAPQAIDTDAGVKPLMQQLAESVDAAQAALRRLKRLFVPKLFVDIWPFLFVLIIASIGGALAFMLLDDALAMQMTIGVGGGAAGSVLLLVLLYLLARAQSRRAHGQLQQHIATAKQLRDAVLESAEQRRDDARRQLRKQRDEEVRSAKKKVRPVLDEISRRHESHLQRIKDKHAKQIRKIEAHRDETLQQARQKHGEITASARAEHEAALNELNQWHEEAISEIEKAYKQSLSSLQDTWTQQMSATYTALDRLQTVASRIGQPWSREMWSDWSPPSEPEAPITLGCFDVDIERFTDGSLAESSLSLPGPARFKLPALLHVPGNGSLLLETTHAEHRPRAMAMVQSVMTRLLTTLPPGKVRFVILDPVSLGQNFAGFMHLADYEGALIGQRIWTEQSHIQQRLVDLTEHMENVIQKYLRNEFETIAQYNTLAGEIAEPYRFLIVADFPTNFTDESARRLTSIVTSGARCGVHTILHLDQRQDLPRGFDIDELRQSAATLVFSDDTCTWNDPVLRDLPLELDAPPDESLLTTIMHDVGQAAVESTRVEVPFDAIAPDDQDIWARSAASEVRVPLGRSGASKIQELALGRATSQHALIAGKTGSGKSTLLHVLITSLALWYRPDEVELYLVDFKKGVEFKTYATHDLPHARVVAIESDREFGLSVLQKLDAEMRRRGDLFRDKGVQDVAGYRQREPDDPMPRVLLIIDEFQEFFTEDDRIAQEAALLLDRLVRQGRAFGMHVLLGSQTLGGAYSLARSTIGQMNVRIALQCSESDSYLIMSEDNAAARLLSRPGEAIYNDAAGLVEGNSPFQVVWLPDSRRDTALQRVQQHMRREKYEHRTSQVVFEGNTPGRLETNNALQKLLTADAWPSPDKPPMIWLGDAVAIKDPTAAPMRKHSGANVLIIGQRSETADCLIAGSLISLGAQRSPNDLRLMLLDGTADDDNRAVNPRDIADVLPHDVQILRPRDVADALGALVADVRNRHESGADTPTTVVLINALHRFRALRHVDDFSFSMDDDKPPSPDKLLAEILRDGPEVDVHVVAWCDSANSLNRMMERATQREFEMRVLMQMSAADSTALIDSPEASRIGLQRAIFSSEDEGVLEKFRPYGPPDRQWLDDALSRLQSRD